jgi:RimJ/RimL family protein N-acetyltransferase
VTGTAALDGIRLTTPRLELRLGSEADVLELGELARRGIHPPEAMPFAVAWTDGSEEPGFLDEFCAYHRLRREEWSPDAWELPLLVWAAGELAGTQSILATEFAHARVASTGSWLGAAYQGSGIGTEMRAAVLELAFRGLGARAATSGWLEGNVASGRVSEKLGYRETGLSEISPRGEPVPHHDMLLEREAWSSPVEVEIEGLEPALPLFGVSRRSA